MTSAGPTSTGFSAPSLPLKRLGPVKENASFYSAKSSEVASSVYSYLKQFAPAGALPHIANLEDTVSSYSYPALAKIQDRGDSILRSLDGQVDYVAKKTGGVYGSASSSVNNLHKDNVQRFHSSKASYHGKLSEAQQYIHKHGVSGYIRSWADYVTGQASHAAKTTEKEAGAVGDRAKQAWTDFQHLPIVEKISSDLGNLSHFAWQKYLTGHDAVLGHPIYHKAYKGTQDTASNLQQTGLYQRAKTQLYPSVAPYADPALDNITSNSYYKAAVDHLKPVQSNGKL